MHIDRPAIVGPERLVLRTSAALYVDDLKAVGEFTVDSGQSVPPRHGRLPSVGLAFLEGKPMSAKGRLARRISSIASFSAGTSADMAFWPPERGHREKSGKRRADWRWAAWIARPRKGGPAVYWACARRRVLITTNGARTEQYLGRQAQAPRRKGFCYHPSPREVDCNFCHFVLSLTQINARRCQTVPCFRMGDDWELIMGLLNSKLPNRFLLENAPEHLKFIGLIAVNHAHLDRKLCRLFSLLAELDSRAAKTFLGRSPMHALAPGAYSTPIVAAGQSGATRDLRGPREALS